MLAGRGLGRITLIAVFFIWIVGAFLFLGGRYNKEWYNAGAEQLEKLKEYGTALTSGNETSTEPAAGQSGKAISYDLTRPPSTGCENIVSKLQLRLIESYSRMLGGIRHVNIWGYLGAHNDRNAKTLG